MEDECHLLWGDTIGYVWGKTNEKTKVEMTNEKQRQTYYGAIDILSGDFYHSSEDKGDSKCTINFIDQLLSKFEGKKIFMIWDSASYHKSNELKQYLSKLNDGLSPENWKVTLELFAPNGPEQNPVEDIWLKGKNFLRKMFIENKTFAKVKKSFCEFYENSNFDFAKVEMYRNFIL